MPKKTLFQKWDDGEVEVSTWFERDRAHIEIWDLKTNKTLAEWWDEEVAELIEDGFFRLGRKFEQSVIEYAESIGIPAYSKK